ncbi:MAG TPA: hypothetical protein VJ521_03125, partial [Acidobacteriota bacterium]|nr:hypothetical protein [Acidobacteriota bacterium]
THLVQRFQQVVSMGINGDGCREYEFHNYTSVRGVKVPQRIVIRNHNAVHGLIENVYNVQDLSPDALFDSKELELPAGFKKADYGYRGSFKVNELSKDVYVLENVTETTGQWSYNVFFVVFDEFVLVAEAPVSSSVSEKVLAKIHEIAPGKKIRYLVQSHHHGDHIGGIRPYIADQVTILAGPGMIPFIEKIAAAPFLLNPDRLSHQPQRPVLEAVAASKIVEDGNHRAVVYNVGPSPHARDMLIVHLPEEKILYQSDLINDGEYPANKTTEHFLQKLKDLNIQANRVVGLHGKIVSRP